MRGVDAQDEDHHDFSDEAGRCEPTRAQKNRTIKTDSTNRCGVGKRVMASSAQPEDENEPVTKNAGLKYAPTVAAASSPLSRSGFAAVAMLKSLVTQSHVRMEHKHSASPAKDPDPSMDHRHKEDRTPLATKARTHEPPRNHDRSRRDRSSLIRCTANRLTMNPYTTIDRLRRSSFVPTTCMAMLISVSMRDRASAASRD